MTDQPDPTKGDEALRGIFVSDGTDFTIHGLSLSLTSDGVEAGHEGVSLRVDLCRQWLRIAVRHVDAAKAAREAVLSAHAQDDEHELGSPLHRECHAAMQAIGATGFALDAFYAAVRERMPNQPSPTWERPPLPRRIRDGIRWIIRGRPPKQWQTKRRTRWKVMAETWRVAFRLKPQLFAEVRQALREVTRFRDMGVHPSAEQRDPILREEVQRGVGWHFMAFRYQNAATCAQIALAILTRILDQPDPKFPELDPYCTGLAGVVDALSAEWGTAHPGYPVRRASGESPTSGSAV